MMEELRREWEAAIRDEAREAEGRYEMDRYEEEREMAAALNEAAAREPWTWARADAAEHEAEARYMAAFGD